MNSFTDTLNRLSDMINSRLSPNIQKVWVQGVNNSSAKLVFTIFSNDNEHEMRLLEGYITQFSKSVLSNTII
jgi:hypothetical protein